METETADNSALGLEVTDITVRQVAGDPYVTLETPYVTWRIKACCARLLGMTLLRAAENILEREAPQLADAPATTERVM
jgi:hypothetical protein